MLRSASTMILLYTMLLFMASCTSNPTVEGVDDNLISSFEGSDEHLNPSVEGVDNILLINERELFIGKWKLMSVFMPLINELNDYSMHNIIYEFTNNSLLTVLNIPENIEYRALSGEYNYSVVLLDSGYFNLRIGLLGLGVTFDYPYQISNNKLVFGYLPLDVPLYSLEKIEQ